MRRYTRQRYLLAGGNPYATGINVNTNNAPINLTLQSGVNVTIPAGSPGVNAVNAANTTGPTATSAPVTITANGVTINNNNNPTGNNRPGCEYSPAATPPLRQRTAQLI